tara:strand:+ start:239 stop:829 length:591 start_codon:yes stop_codon:yes gene_type:complete
MKIVALLLLFIFSTFSYSQNTNFGIEVSPSFELQSIKNKNTGLLSSISGYGFNIGMPIKFNVDNEKSISSGITYEFTAFDNKINNYLASSLRLNSLNVPLIYNIPVIQGFYFNTGIGINYIFLSKQFGGGIWLNTNTIVNQFQPYLAAGLSTLVDLGTNNYELGVNARYHLIDIWKNTDQTRTNIIAIDLNMKYYF